MATGGNTRGRWTNASNSVRPGKRVRVSSHATSTASGKLQSTLRLAISRLSRSASVSSGLSIARDAQARARPGQGKDGVGGVESAVCLRPASGIQLVFGRFAGDAQTLLQERARRRVLQMDLLARAQILLHREGRQRGFVEARQDQLLLARIVVDVAD